MADRKLFFYVVFLLSFSTIMTYSLGAYAVEFYGYGEFHFFIRQSFAVALGILLMWIFSQIKAEKLMGFGFALFFLSLLLIIIMQFLPDNLASSAGGAKRWIRLPGVSLAPSEFFKIGFVVFLAWSFPRKFIGKKRENLLAEFLAILPYMCVFALIIFFIAVMQNDLGQVVLMALILGIMLLFVGGSWKLLGILVLAALGIVGALVLTSAHRIARIKAWWASVQDLVLKIFPENIAQTMRIDSAQEPYQVYYSIAAMNNGGIFGEGFGNGVIKLGFLSEVHTDMVLAGFTEEAGFVGLGIFVFVFILILHRILKIANHTENNTHALFCIGIVVMLGFSFLINAFGITGVIPIKGIAVPFLSYGGSAILASCIAIGMVLSISKNAKITP